jgi:formylglycine-generating enzyme required for sulfatase activity
VPTEGVEVRFDDRSIGSPTAWEWSFGDGSASHDQNPAHVYYSTGEYQVSLTVTNQYGSDTEIQQLVVESALLSDDLSVMLPGNVELELRRLPAGTFLMGAAEGERNAADNEYPQHQVTLTRDIYVGTNEITQAQWQAVMGTNPAHDHGVGDDVPVYFVSWEDIAGSNGFLERLNLYLSATGQPGAGLFRLPTEAEWEYAARAGTQTRFFFGDALECSDSCEWCEAFDQHVWWCGNQDPLGAKAVGLKTPNGFGLSDVHGNVNEWVSDWYGAYSAEPQVDPTGPETGQFRVFRGGSWDAAASTLRSADRKCRGPDDARFEIGFRLVCSGIRPEADFSWSPLRPIAGEVVQLFDTSRGSPTSWSWSFGDGTTSEEQNPSHTWSDPGTYEVSLEIANESGTDRLTGQVVIASATDLEQTTVTLPGEVPLVLVRVPAGSFMMGAAEDERSAAPSEYPQHEVTISHDLWVGKFEITQAQWQAVMGSNPGLGYGEGEHYPVYDVSWNDIAGPGGYLVRLNQHLAATGQTAVGELRLPTEAEWEYVARAGTTTRFSFGDALECWDGCRWCLIMDQHMWWCGNNRPWASKRVGWKEPNAFGLYDMHGNVHEWVADWFGDYSAGSQIDPSGPETGTFKVFRGGAWDSAAYLARSADRHSRDPDDHRYEIGVRVVAGG